MSTPATLRIERLTPERRADYLAFFDHERGPAFADNPEWAKCYCHYYQVPVALTWRDFDGVANRMAMDARIAAGEMEGYMAYDGDEVVGWMNAQPYTKLRHACTRLRIAPTKLPVPAHNAAAIVCFVIPPQRRRQGVATSLLAGGLANLTARGIALVDAFPWNTAADATSAADHYHGTMSMFVHAGFESVVRHDDLTVVRKMLR
ncbi:MAG: GNAT family N-acetyltransferase [Betaproteobacteria bacterium]